MVILSSLVLFRILVRRKLLVCGEKYTTSNLFVMNSKITLGKWIKAEREATRSVCLFKRWRDKAKLISFDKRLTAALVLFHCYVTSIIYSFGFGLVSSDSYELYEHSIIKLCLTEVMS